MKVKNLNNTTGKTCNCDSWYDHWYRHSSYHRKTCANLDCNNDAAVGAHVIKYNSTDKKHYIVPLCHKCNHTANDKAIDIGTAKLVSANKAKTCKK